MAAQQQQQETELAAARDKAEAAQQALNLKAVELKRIRALSRQLLDQRSEAEQFFLESLDITKKEIAATRARYAQAAKARYNESMRAGALGDQPLPPVRDFSLRALEAEFKKAEDSAEVDMAAVSERDSVFWVLICTSTAPNASWPLATRSQYPLTLHRWISRT